MQQLEISQQIVVKREAAVGNIPPLELQDEKEIHPRPEQKQRRPLYFHRYPCEKNQARKGPDGSASLSVLQHFADNLYRFFFNQLAMLFAEEAFAVDLVGVFGA